MKKSPILTGAPAAALGKKARAAATGPMGATVATGRVAPGGKVGVARRVAVQKKPR